MHSDMDTIFRCLKQFVKALFVTFSRMLGGNVVADIVVRARRAQLPRDGGAVRANRRRSGGPAHGLQPVGAGAGGPGVEIVPEERREELRD